MQPSNSVIHTPRRMKPFSLATSYNPRKKTLFFSMQLIHPDLEKSAPHLSHFIPSNSQLRLLRSNSTILYSIFYCVVIIFLHSTFYLNITHYCILGKLCICVHVSSFYIMFLVNLKISALPNSKKIRQTVCVHQHFT